MKALPVFIIGIAAWVVLGAAVLLVLTSETPFTGPSPPPVEFRDRDPTTTPSPSALSRCMVPLCRMIHDARTAYAPHFTRAGPTLRSTDQVRYELSTMEPLELSFPHNPEGTCTLTRVIRSPDGRVLPTSTTTIHPVGTGGSASQRVSMAG